MASQLWQRLRALRKHTGLSGEAFGAEVGVSKAAVSQWENPDPAKRTAPDLAKVIDMASRFGVPLDWLLDDRSDVDLEWWVDAKRDLGSAAGLEPEEVQFLDNLRAGLATHAVPPEVKHVILQLVASSRPKNKGGA